MRKGRVRGGGVVSVGRCTERLNLMSKVQKSFENRLCIRTDAFETIFVRENFDCTDDVRRSLGNGFIVIFVRNKVGFKFLLHFVI